MARSLRGEHLGQRLRGPWQMTVAVASIAGGIAAVAVFFIPTADSRVENVPTHSSSNGSPSITSTAASPSSKPAASGAVPSPGEVRDLAGLTPVIGPGLVESEGVDLLLRCPSNQSDDREREVSYALPRPFARLETSVSASGQSGPDDSAAVQVFIVYRQERSDRRSETARVVVGPGADARLSASVSNAVEVTLRLTCSSPSQIVRLTHPVLAVQ